MFWKLSRGYAFLALGVVTLVAATFAWRFAFFIAPFAWTNEPARLARVLGLRPGMQIADIGAGSGALAVAMASFVGSSGQVYATELAPERRADIERRIRRASIGNVQAVAATEDDTGLPARCCDAVYMRAVFHHIPNQSAFVTSVARVVRAGGRVAVIDFAPGTLWFHDADHGVQPEIIMRVFQEAGFRLRDRVDEWGGGMFLLVFERDAVAQQ